MIEYLYALINSEAVTIHKEFWNEDISIYITTYSSLHSRVYPDHIKQFCNTYSHVFKIFLKNFQIQSKSSIHYLKSFLCNFNCM